MTEDKKHILQKLKKNSREGWAEQAKVISEAGDDVLVLGDFDNDEDQHWHE